MKTQWNDIYNLFFLYENCVDEDKIHSLFEYLEIDYNKVYKDYKVGEFIFDYAFLKGKTFIFVDLLYISNDDELKFKNKISSIYFEKKIESIRNDIKNKNIIYIAKGYKKNMILDNNISLEDFFCQIDEKVNLKNNPNEYLLICNKKGYEIYDENGKNIAKRSEKDV